MTVRSVYSLPESDLFEIEWVLDDAGGGNPHAEDVLLRRQIARLRYSVEVGEIAEMGFLPFHCASMKIKSRSFPGPYYLAESVS